METAAIRTPGRASERLTGEFSLAARSSGGLRTHRGLQPALEMSAGLRSEHGLPANSQRMSGSQVKYLLWKVPETQSGAGGGGGGGEGWGWVGGGEVGSPTPSFPGEGEEIGNQKCSGSQFSSLQNGTLASEHHTSVICLYIHPQPALRGWQTP